MNVIVLGAGAIGSIYAAKLASRHDVTVVARRAHAEAINHAGLRLLGQEETTCRLRATTAIDSIPPGALVLLTTKVNDNRAAIESVAHLIHADTVVLCVQNGLSGEDIVKSIVGDRCTVIRAITQFGAIFREPGVIDYKVAGHTFIERHRRSPEIAAAFTACGLDGRVSDDIRIEIWRKLIFNCVINPITSIVGAEVGSIADPGLDPLKRLVIEECVQVARADGIQFDVDFMRTIADVFGSSRNVASMRQDLLKGRPTEIDFMNGAVVDLGRRSGISCPVNAALVAIIKAMEARASLVVP
jgi:2-dehydropantoate 2-reductase